MKINEIWTGVYMLIAVVSFVFNLIKYDTFLILMVLIQIQNQNKCSK